MPIFQFHQVAIVYASTIICVNRISAYTTEGVRVQKAAPQNLQADPAEDFYNAAS